MPIFSRPLVMAAASVYFAAVVAIGLWSMRRTKSAKDFWIAGQRIGLWVTGLAATSAAFSGFVFIGGPGLMYSLGLASMWIVVPVGFTPALHCWVLGKRLRLLAGKREVYTIPDAILARYRSRAASGIAAFAVLVGTVAYLGSQFLALGRLLEAVFGTRALAGEASLLLAMSIGAFVLLLYSVLGGMLAGVYTDLLQGGLMVLVAVAVFFHTLSVGGGLEQTVTSIASSDAFGPAFLSPVGRLPALTAFGFFYVFAVGTLGQPQVLHKFFMIDDPLKLKWFPLLVGTAQSLCLLIWLGVGLVVPALVATGRLAPLGQPDDAAPVYLLNFAPSALAGLVLAGLLAAIMSTADSFLNIGSAALVRDLPRAFGLGFQNELLWGRIAVSGVALAALGLAFVHGDLVALLGTFAFGTFGAALAPALAVGLNWRRVTSGAAIASMVTGIGVNSALELLARWSFVDMAPGVLPAAVATSASFTVLLAWSVIAGEPGPRAIDDDVAAVMNA